MDGNTIKTDIYYKPTNNHCYIPFFAKIHKNIKINIPFCLFSRINKITSETDWKEFRFYEMFKILSNLKYPQQILLNSTWKVLNIDKIPTRKNDKKIVPFVSSVNNEFYNKKLVHLKTYYEQLFDVKICKIQNKQVDFITFMNQKSPKNKFSITKCLKSSCLLCDKLICYTSSLNISNRHLDFLNDNCCCDSQFCIYLLKCANCEAFYIGKAESKLKIRFNLHRHQMKNTNESEMQPVHLHLKNCSNFNYFVTIIYKEKSKKPLKLLFAEKFFISLLNPLLNFSF